LLHEDLYIIVACMDWDIDNVKNGSFWKACEGHLVMMHFRRWICMSNVVSPNFYILEYNFYVIENMHNMKNQLPSAMLFEPYAIES